MANLITLSHLLLLMVMVCTAPPICQLAIAAGHARARRMALAGVSAYADSHQELPLLIGSGRAVAVRPGRQMARLAAQCHWEILGDRSADRDGFGSLSVQQ